MIRCQYHNIERQFTEVLASWLKASPNPSWGEVVAALKSVDKKDLADRLIQKLLSKLSSESAWNYHEVYCLIDSENDDPEETFNEVDNSKLGI